MTEDATPYTVPKERGSWRALTLAALVHLALLALLWIGVRWQNETPATIEAEVWNPVPREAAPLPEPPKPEPEVKPEPKPVPREVPKPKVEEPPVVKPDIALAQEKKRKEEEKKRREEEERREKEKKKKLEEEQKLAKLEEAKRKEKEKADQAKKEAEQKRREEQLLAKMREDEMKRIAGGVTGTGGSGEAARSQGGRASGDYLARIGAKIRSNINFIPPEGLQGNPPVEYEVRLLPDGSVAGLRKVRSSGVTGFDEAVERAIQRSQPFPRDTNGTVPSSFIGSHRPKDQ
ncbi:MAG TPA: energy transducer TonB [Noviherbaspirillum sp.]|uniref:energy transducer TonB n=1 Tax=Noviherbaspirillum sp. TaxID=1926288 RepID=UPI002D5651C0|nr:energy transducer TonB [Noviherbaspirillum sp.]HYD97180.1 energy transducer TonB [Noviherbaspirillum sp.]